MAEAQKKPSVLIAMTGFKGSLSNIEACKAVAEGLTKAEVPHQILPLGDGGRGTSLPVHLILGGEYVPMEAFGPLGNTVLASVLCFPNSISPRWIFIESSDTCGWALVNEQQRDAMNASSYGLGILLKNCWEKWHASLKDVYVGLGDSAVSDVGIGMLNALGVLFFDADGSELSATAENLSKISTFEASDPILPKLNFTILCDVQNPLCGHNGSARVFSPQKGASFQQVLALESGMENFSNLIEKAKGKTIGLRPMTGSAGGLATAFLAFFSSRLEPGCEFLLHWLNFDALIEQHDIVITGEGRTDKQTLARKAPAVVADHATKLGKHFVLISGSLGSGWEELKNSPHVLGCFESGRSPNPYDALVSKTTEVTGKLKWR